MFAFDKEKLNNLIDDDKIKDIIARENPLKPTSDAKISSALSDEGYQVARRTVAKYRELENIKQGEYDVVKGIVS